VIEALSHHKSNLQSLSFDCLALPNETGKASHIPSAGPQGRKYRIVSKIRDNHLLLIN
jgi:hypothetical protein